MGQSPASKGRLPESLGLSIGVHTLLFLVPGSALKHMAALASGPERGVGEEGTNTVHHLI